MKYNVLSAFNIATTSCFGQTSDHKTSNRKAIICLTYDDALDSQLFIAEVEC